MDVGAIIGAVTSSVLALGTIAGAIVAIVQVRTDSLKRAERLAALAPQMKLRSPERKVIENERDAAAVGWYLRLKSPKHRGLQITGITMVALGLVIMIGGQMLNSLFDFNIWTGIGFYVGGLAVYIGGIAVIARRSSLRTAWRKAELRKTGLLRHDPDPTPVIVRPVSRPTPTK